MIFVTVGTTMPFDELIEALDRLVAKGELPEPVVCQIGNGHYQPRHCDYFRFAPSLEAWVRDATLVIGHGGTGTVLSLLANKKPFIVVVNPRGAHDHQGQFLERLSKVVTLLWTRDLDELPDLISKTQFFVPTAVVGARLAEDLKVFLEDG